MKKIKQGTFVLTKTQNKGNIYTRIESKHYWCNTAKNYLVNKINEYEQKVYDNLDFKKQKYAVQQQFFEIDNRIFFADIFIHRYKILIEIDGEYHTQLQRKMIDEIRDSLCEKECIRVYRISNNEIDDDAIFSKFIDIINNAQLLNNSMQNPTEDELHFLQTPNFLKNGINKKHIREIVLKDGVYCYEAVKHKKFRNNINKNNINKN